MIGTKTSGNGEFSRWGSMPSTLYRLLLVVALLGLAGNGRAQDVIGMHDLSLAGTSPTKGTLAGSCLYCHAPHSGLNGAPGVSPTPLWNTKLSQAAPYQLNTTLSLVNPQNPSPPLGTDTTLCLSCHDGTVGGSPGATVAYGQVAMSGKMNGADVFSNNDL